MSAFGHASTADEVLADVDLDGRRVLVTGGYSGLGKETARAMAAKGAHIILAGRDESKLHEAAINIAEETGARIDTLLCDLASLASVRSAADEAHKRFNTLDLLNNNAGVMACPKRLTADGFEMQFGTNHLGHFLLTNLLVPLLRQGDRPRIVNVSSRGHHIAPVDFDDPNFAHREYDKWVSYGQSKTANVLFTVGLEQRLGGNGIHAFALHPGGIMTNLSRHMDDKDMADLLARIRAAAQARGEEPEPFKTIAQGAATTCWAATAPELDGRGGLYAEDCHIAKVDDTSTKGGVRSYAMDPANADRLWTLSEEMVGETFAW